MSRIEPLPHGHRNSAKLPSGLMQSSAARKRDIMFVSLASCILTIDARRRCHVQTLGGFDVTVIVNPDEAAFVFTFKSCACRPMRFIAYDEIEFWKPHTLGLCNPLNRLIS